MSSSRTFKLSGSSDACFYRLFDIFALFFAFQCSALFYNFNLSSFYMVSVLSVALIYLYCAEIFSTYRSWRAGKFRVMMLCVWGALLVSFACLFFISFIFKFSESLSRIGISLWFLLSMLYLYLWRLAVY
ncbi:MAG: undecaprenyl-phosphate glucose phosphotransferase, partial [Pseudoalteromonas nigrifaciens]